MIEYSIEDFDDEESLEEDMEEMGYSNGRSSEEQSADEDDEDEEMKMNQSMMEAMMAKMRMRMMFEKRLIILNYVLVVFFWYGKLNFSPHFLTTAIMNLSFIIIM